MCQNESFQHFPCPRKKKNENEVKNESHHDNSWNLLYILANLYLSEILSSLVQKQLGHHLYHPTFKGQTNKHTNKQTKTLSYK